MKISSFAFFLLLILFSCKQQVRKMEAQKLLPVIDSSAMPSGPYGEYVRYGRELLYRTAYYIGPRGIGPHYTANRINCTNCHQEGGTKPYSFSLMRSHERYPSYRPREDRVLSLAERINNCVMRPHSGKPLPLDCREMIAFQAYLRWINSFVVKRDSLPGEQNLFIAFPERAADPLPGEKLYAKHCASCHQMNGSGMLMPDSISYLYPPLWGMEAYQPGSSMHRVTMMARWLKANMPHQIAKWDQPVLTDEEALDIAAFVNDDRIHERPSPTTFDYPNAKSKPMDYGKGPYIDPFPESQHKFGPYPPIILWWKEQGLKLVR